MYVKRECYNMRANLMVFQYSLYIFYLARLDSTCDGSTCVQFHTFIQHSYEYLGYRTNMMHVRCIHTKWIFVCFSSTWIRRSSSTRLFLSLLLLLSRLAFRRLPFSLQSVCLFVIVFFSVILLWPFCRRICMVCVLVYEKRWTGFVVCTIYLKIDKE